MLEDFKYVTAYYSIPLTLISHPNDRDEEKCIIKAPHSGEYDIGNAVHQVLRDPLCVLVWLLYGEVANIGDWYNWVDV